MGPSIRGGSRCAGEAIRRGNQRIGGSRGEEWTGMEKLEQSLLCCSLIPLRALVASALVLSDDALGLVEEGGGFGLGGGLGDEAHDRFGVAGADVQPGAAGVEIHA